MIRAGQYLNIHVLLHVFKYVCVFRTVLKNTLDFIDLSAVLKYGVPLAAKCTDLNYHKSTKN